MEIGNAQLRPQAVAPEIDDDIPADNSTEVKAPVLDNKFVYTTVVLGIALLIVVSIFIYISKKNTK